MTSRHAPVQLTADWQLTVGGLANSDSVTPLAENAQRAIAYRYTELQAAINRGSPAVGRKYGALCKVYRGKSRKFLNSLPPLAIRSAGRGNWNCTCLPKLSRNSGRLKDIKPLPRN